MQRLTAKLIGMVLGALLGLLVVCAHAQRADVLWMANGGAFGIRGADIAVVQNKLLAVSGYYLYPMHYVTYVWNLETRQLILISQLEGRLAFSHDGRYLAIVVGAGSSDSEVVITDLSNKSAINRLSIPGARAAVFSPDGLLAVGRYGEVRFFTVPDGAQVLSIQASSGVDSLAFSPDGQLLAGGGNGEVLIWRRNGTLAQRLTGNFGRVDTIAFSTDGQRLASANYNETRIWQLRDGNFVLSRGLRGAERLFFVDSQRVVLSGSTGTIVLNAETGIEEKVYNQAHHGGVSVFLSEDISVTLHRAYGIFFWRRSDGQLVDYLPGHRGIVNAVAFSPNGELIATASSDRTMRCWRAIDGTQEKVVTGHTNDVTAVAFSPNGQLIATGSRDRTLRLWDAANGEAVATLNGHTNLVSAVAFSPNGELIASASLDGTARVWRVADRTLAQPPIILGNASYAVAFSPNGERLATAVGAIVRIWNLSDGNEVARATGHTDWVRKVAFSPDGQLLATCSDDGTVRLWQSSNGLQVRQINTPATSLRFSPDGQMLVTVGIDATIRFWRVSDGTELERYDLEAIVPLDVAYSPDGERVAVVGQHGTVMVARAYREGMNRRPSPPTLIAPENDVTVPLTPTFRVGVQDPDGNKVKAIIEIIDSGGGSRTVESDFVNSGSEASVRLTTPLAEGRYSWRARVQDEGGLLSDWSGFRTFRAAQTGIPEPPELLEPANNATVGLRPVFRMRLNDPDSEPMKARVEISNASGVVATLESDFVNSGAVASVQPEEPLTPGAYTWRARAIDNSGNESEWSGSLSFSVVEEEGSVTVGVPELISPASNAYTVRTPTFRVRASQPSGARVYYEIRLIRGDDELIFTTDEATVGATVVLRLNEDEPLEAGQWQWQARTITVDGLESNWSSLRPLNVMGEEAPPALEPGVHAFAFSFAGSDVSVADVGLQGAELYYWDPAQGAYLRANQLQSGVGYFVRITRRTTLELSGTPATSEVRVNLRAGWNLIASPFITPIAWNLDAIRVERNGEVKTLREAQQAGWLEDYLWTWDLVSERYTMVYDSRVLPGVQSAMLPWRSYWILALQDCTLILSPELTANSRSVAPLGFTPSAWSLRVEAETARGVSNPVWIGAASGRSVQMATAPTPPTVQAQGVQLRIRRGAAQYSADLRADYGRSTRWELEVVAPPDTQAQTVTLRFGNLMHLPRGVNLALVEEGTGRRYLLRSRSAHSFTVPAEGGVYRFTVEPVSSRQVLRILTPTVQSAGRGGATTLRYSLTTEAQVQVQIRAGGRTVRTLTHQATRSAGSQEALWDGRDDAGVQLPPGQYIAEITAISEDGQVARATVPVVKTR